MPKYRVTHEDGRETEVHSDREDLIKSQANHEEMTRVVIADKRGMPRGPEPSIAVSYVKIKD